jgi:hypothetical protein
MFKRLVFWWYNHKQGGRDRRHLSRVVRRELIKQRKENIMKDLMTGHNVGDFNISKEDLSTILRFGGNISFTKILKLYEKYRGNDLTYRD